MADVRHVYKTTAVVNKFVHTKKRTSHLVAYFVVVLRNIKTLLTLFGFRTMAKFIKASDCYPPRPTVGLVNNRKLSFDNSRHHTQHHPITVKYSIKIISIITGL